MRLDDILTLVKHCGVVFLTTYIAVGSDEGFKPAAEYPAASPDGTKVAFVSNTSGDRDIWLSNIDGGNARALTAWANSDERHPSWSPDGARIVLSSTRGTTKRQIWTIDSNGGGSKAAYIRCG